MNAAVWIYILVTLAAILWLSWQYSLAVESMRWPRARGKVLKAWVERSDNEYAYYSPRVEYAYEVDGVAYSSKTIWLTGDRSMLRGRAERMAARYPVGDSVEVRYDPKKPTRATLKPGGAGWLLVSLVAISVVGPLLAFAFTDAGRSFLGQIGIRVE
jgi:hypothetical protein